MPGLWYARPFSLACSALEQDHLWFLFWGAARAEVLHLELASGAQQTPRIFSKLPGSPSKNPRVAQGRWSRVGELHTQTHRGCSSPEAALPPAAWSWLRWRLSTSLAGESLV